MENHNIIVIISDEINMKLTSFFNPKIKTNDMNHKNIEQDILTCLVPFR